MPTMLIEEPLGITCIFSDGARADFSLHDLPNPHLARDLATGLVDLIHPHGTVDASGTVNHYVQSLRQITRVLADHGFTGGADQLRRGMLAEYWMGSTGPREATSRAMVCSFARSGGVLAEGVLDLAAGRPFNQQPNHHQLPPYPEADCARLTEACRTLIEASYAAHRQALAVLPRGRHPRLGDWNVENQRWLLARLGPLSAPQFADALGITEGALWQRGGFLKAHADLFPTHNMLIAYRLLFGIYSGIVPDGIDDLVTDDIDWAGDATILLSYIKGRTAAESLTLPRRAVRLLEQWLSHSALLRSHAGPEHRRELWLAQSHPGQRTVVTGSGARAAVQRWVVRYGVLGQDGSPLKIHRSRIRTTHLAMREKSSWTGSGRAVIDPNHTPAVEGDHYLSATTPAQQHNVESVIEDAQHDLLRRAHPPTVITQEDAAVLAEGYPQLLA
jgi:hypothetical protein